MQFYKGAKGQLINPLLQNLSPISNYNYGLPANLLQRDRFLRGLGLNPSQLALTPAYNQRAYMVATRLPLGDFFNSLPTDEAEIIASSNCTVGLNLALIGNIIYQFRTAELVDVNTYQIPTITNERRGTDGVRSPVIGDRFVLLTGTNARIVKIQGSISDLNQVRYFKAVSRGQTLAEVAPTAITIAGISQRPYRPKNLRATRDAVGNITITWQRRDRRGELIENPPLSEDFEQYVVQILSGTLPQTVVRSHHC